jgi:Na+/proline symporter
VVILQFLLFLLIGSAIYAAGQAPDSLRPDEIFPRFVTGYLPAGLAGLVIAAIMAAAMSTQSSAINALASSVTHDWYATMTGRNDPVHLLRVGRWVSLFWAVGITLGALAFHYLAGGQNTPVVVLALSIASVTYGALLGTYILATRFQGVRGNDVILGMTITVALMLVTIFAGRLSTMDGLGWLAPLGRLAWPWYVPIGTALTVLTGLAASGRPGGRRKET